MKRCDIPSMLVGRCDLEWGHRGLRHSNHGDTFYARAHEDEHRRRQKVRREERART